MINKPIFWDYITTDEEGEMNGIKDDAPKEIKIAYENYMKEKEKQKEDLFKI